MERRRKPIGGSLLATVEGEPTCRRAVILVFEDMECFRTWYDSPEYQASERHASTDEFGVLVQGF